MTFGGDIQNGNGYGLKDELMSKPVYASGHGKVYIGIARWIDSTNGDTQSLYSVDDNDSISLVSNVYSAGGAHCLYPTFDIAYDSNQDLLYFFYLKTGGSSTCGHTYYKTYNGSTFGTDTAFFTVANRSVDIPVTYQTRYDDKILLFFRVNNAVDPGTPPHDIYFGYVTLNDTSTNPYITSSTPYSATTYADFNQTCTTLSSTQVINGSGGEVALASSFRDDFETPRSPYTRLFTNKWSTGVWGTGTYEPEPDGSLLVYSSAGAYAIGATSFNKKVMDFRAQFTSHNFQHIGWADSIGFGNYIIFSTMTNGQLNARVESGSGETNTQLGSSYLGSYHNYRIEWGGDIKFYIDDFTTPVATFNVNETDSLKPVLSNNTTTSGSNLTVDWLRLNDYPATSGTYISCSLDSGSAGTVWGTLSYGATTPASTSVTLATRSSSDNETWSSWSSAITSGETVSSPNNRYLQYRASLAGTSTDTSTFTNLSLAFASPTPTPTATPTPTHTPTPTPTTNTNSNSSSSSGNTTGSTTEPPSCNAQSPGINGPKLIAAIPISATSIRLFFTDAEKPVTHYTLAYGSRPDFLEYGQPNIGSWGLREYVVEYLSPQTTYYFQIQSKNNCAVGPSSNLISAKTAALFHSPDLSISETTLTQVNKSETVDLCKPYTVKSGDNLWDIVMNTLKDLNQLDTVKKLNKNTYPSIENDDLQIGWSLRLKDCSEESRDDLTQNKTYEKVDVTIEVKDKDNKPVEGATVTLHSTPRTRKTDSNGIAFFKDVEKGEHRVVISYADVKGEQSLYLSGEADEYNLSIKVEPKNPFLSIPFITLAVLSTMLICSMLLYIRNLKLRVSR